MTPERWRRVGELFAAALRIEPAGRDAWLRGACGDDEVLRAEVARLLSRDAAEGPDRTRTWPGPGPVERRLQPSGRTWIDHRRATDVAGGRGFSPRAVIASGPPRHASSATEPVVRARLRELPMIYILFLAMATFWRCVVLGDGDRVLHVLDGSVIASLGGVVVLLSGRRRFTIAGLRAVELLVIGLFAGRAAIVEYRLVLLFSMRHDPVMAQLTVKNIALLAAVMVLTYGLYVPKTCGVPRSWGGRWRCSRMQSCWSST